MIYNVLTSVDQRKKYIRTSNTAHQDAYIILFQLVEGVAGFKEQC